MDWPQVSDCLDKAGVAVLPGLLSSHQCLQLQSLYSEETLFRKRVQMTRHGFGSGEYQYFTYPLPDSVQSLREEIYSHLVATANRWHQQLNLSARFPKKLQDYLRDCQQFGQVNPTPLLLKYQAGDYNCLHQDLYGEQVFPLQLVVLLSKPGIDFTGGQFVITEQRPRMQSRVNIIELQQGDAAVFAVNFRPRLGSRGYHRVKLRHGVSTLNSGERFTLGIIFHDAA